ncbi:hypothetical protein [Streptacidiphilus fuscans]|uniref:Uncharacterized protein n=1 Tax=Streptacidiphilus fuscans TaxID=2789292 RepID=A0A931FAN1_9ACTN|nr:hypothetical protein [Streptacidiphilus fuscans]MBF9066573.1 hypothetical protein [Streptacidiphilus fuscans]
MSAPGEPYPETKVPFVWPVLGVRTWTPPDQSFFGTCNATGTADDHVCTVGVQKVNGHVYGCDCLCHAERRARLANPKG